MRDGSLQLNGGTVEAVESDAGTAPPSAAKQKSAVRPAMRPGHPAGTNPQGCAPSGRGWAIGCDAGEHALSSECLVPQSAHHDGRLSMC